MKIVSITGNYEKLFWNHVNRDPIDYYFFILDWTQRKKQTKIFLAVEGNRVLGSLLAYTDYIVQFRGSRKAVQKLLGYVNLEKVEMQAPLIHVIADNTPAVRAYSKVGLKPYKTYLSIRT
ncbi:MAG: hypothetical protein ACP5IM_06645 [Candidatus Bathyarchaeia archaeon]